MRNSWKTAAIIVSLAVTVGGCGSEDPTPATTSAGPATAPRQSTVPVTSSITPTTSEVAATCPAPAADLDETVTMVFDGLERSYDIVAPATTEPLPLVVAFHGFTQSSGLHASMTGLEKAALEQGFIVVLPMGSTLEGSIRPYFNLATTDDKTLADDVGFVAAILDDVTSTHCVDESRIYASGWSNGGLMAATLACVLPGRFAAVASVSGTVLRDDCPEEPTPIIILHGTHDSIVPFSDAADDYMYEVVIGLGGKALQASMFAAVDRDPDDYIAMWLDHNGCNEQETVVSDEGGLEITEYEQCAPHGDVEVVIADKGGHRWAKYPTDRILDFLFEHRLPSQ